jgi:hypothetical protein
LGTPSQCRSASTSRRSSSSTVVDSRGVKTVLPRFLWKVADTPTRKFGVTALSRRVGSWRKIGEVDPQRSRDASKNNSERRCISSRRRRGRPLMWLRFGFRSPDARVICKLPLQMLVATGHWAVRNDYWLEWGREKISHLSAISRRRRRGGAFLLRGERLACLPAGGPRDPMDSERPVGRGTHRQLVTGQPTWRHLAL